MDKTARLTDLRSRWENCEKCKLSETRNSIVFGNGNPDADILIVGKSPDDIEDVDGSAVIGETGDVLRQFFDHVKLSLKKDTFVTNLVSCRPTANYPDDHTNKLVTVTRNPTTEERNTCKDRLLQTLYIVDPLIVVALGTEALTGLVGKVPTITKSRGRIFNAKIKGTHTTVTYPVLSMYPPQYLAKSFDHRPEGPWGQTSRDVATLCTVIDYLRASLYGIQPIERKPSD